jgi:predicted site-specific integrase-resolvase
MKLSEYARQNGISYKTAWRWWKEGTLPGKQMPSGTVIVEEPREPTAMPQRVAVYVRVSSTENRTNLEAQAERVSAYCAAHGYQVQQMIKEIGSGLNEQRPKFLAILADPTITHIVVEHKDRATRFGFRYLETLLAAQGRAIEVVNVAESDTADLVTDLVSIVYSFAARLYGQRRAKRKAAAVQAFLEQEDGTEQRASGGDETEPVQRLET